MPSIECLALVAILVLVKEVFFGLGKLGKCDEADDRCSGGGGVRG